MAVNQVIVNGEELVNLRNDTVTPETLVEGETATNREGEHIQGELDPVSHDEAYLIDDPEGDIDDSDYIPFYDVSDEEEPKKKTLFSSILDKLRSIFATKTGNNITDNNDKDTFRQNIHTLEWLGTDIPDNSDLDTYTTAGNYRVVSDASGGTIANLPLALCGKVIVFNNGNSGIEQFYFANHSPRIFVRTKFGSEAWTNWLELGSGGGSSDPHTYQTGTIIPANSDINTYMTEGVYSTGGNHSTISNLPTNNLGNSSEGKLIVSITNIGNRNAVRQIFNDRYIRIHNGTSWADWFTVAYAENTYQLDGSSISKIIEENDDLNNLSKFVYDCGTFECKSSLVAESLSHCPVTKPFKMVVDKGLSGVRQTITITGDIDELDESIWTRVWNEGSQVHVFSDWVKIATKNDLTAHTYEMGTNIPANSDFDNYKTEGVYYVSNATDASTISNIPVSSAGKFIVMDRDTGARLFQIYMISRDEIYMRDMNNDSVFSDWRNITKKHTYEVGTSIPASSDLNTYIVDGVYKISPDATAQTIVNIPSHGTTIVGGKLIVSKGYSSNENYIIQTYIANDAFIYVRRSADSGTSWSVWKQLASTDDISPSTVGNGYAVATVSGSAITATISGFKLRAGVIATLYFGAGVAVDCTLNISSTGAKPIRYWNNNAVSIGANLRIGNHTFIYDGTYYRVIAHERTPLIDIQEYVADTSGNVLIEWGYGSNRAQIKHNLSNNKLVWNYYKNSAWRGDYNIVDEYGRQTMVGWLGLKTNGGRTIASGAHSLAVSDTIPNILNELRYSNGAWGSFNLTTAYTLNGTTIPTGWYNYFYMPHRVGGENWATPTSWDSDNVNYGTLMLFGMNNTNGVFRVRMNPSGGSSVPVEVVKMADQNDTGASVAKVGKSILPLWDYTTNTWSTNGITFTFNPTTGQITVNGTATADVDCRLLEPTKYQFRIPKGEYILSGCPSGGSDTKYSIRLAVYDGTNVLGFNDYGSGCKVTLSKDCYSSVSANTGFFLIRVKSGQTLSNLLFKPMLRPAFTTAEHEPCEDIHKGNCYVGTCTTAGATKDKVAYVDGYFVLRKGVRVAIKYSNTNSYSSTASSPVTLNVNNTGAKNIWWNNNHTGAVNHGNNTIIFGVANRYVYYLYDGTYWVWDGYSLEENSTYNPNTLGFGYGICTTAEATTAKVVTLANYNLISGGYVTVRFDYNVPANATLNVNNRGAKSIYYRGVALKANTIKVGDKATFIFDGTYFHLLSIDRISCGRENCIGFSNIKFGQVASTLVNTANSHVRGEIIGGVLYFNMELRFSASGTLPSYASTEGGIFMIPNITAYAFRMAHGEYGNNYVPCYVNTITYDGSTGLMFMLRNQLAVNTSSTLKISFEIPITNGVAF